MVTEKMYLELTQLFQKHIDESKLSSHALKEFTQHLSANSKAVNRLTARTSDVKSQRIRKANAMQNPNQMDIQGEVKHAFRLKERSKLEDSELNCLFDMKAELDELFESNSYFEKNF
jgi:hypothetical protein